MRAMVLAAGVGSRLEPLTSRIPKPLVPVANTPVMEHILRHLKLHGYDEVISNLHHLPDRLTEYFGGGERLGVDLTFFREEILSGDAGGVRACRSYFRDQTFVVLMGDLLTDVDLTAVVRAHKEKGALATIAVKQVEDVSQFGVVLRDEEGFIKGFQEKPLAGEALSNLASTGIYVLEPEIFSHIPQTGMYGFGRQLFPALVAIGAPVLAFEFSGYWSDVGTIAQYRQSNFDALEGKISVCLPGEATSWGFVGEDARMAPGAAVQGLALVGARSRIGSGVLLSGRVIIGNDCQIADGAVIEDSVIWSGTMVGAGAEIRHSVFGSNCVVSDRSKHLETAAVAPSPSQLCRS